MTKKRALEVLTRLWLVECRTLDKVRETRGPEAWGDCPADLVARYHVGRRDALAAALKAMKEARS